MLRILLATLIVVGSCSAQSLWNPTRKYLPVFADTTARGVGDILTVLIDEDYRVENDETTDFTKESTLSALISNFDIAPDIFDDRPFPRIDGSASREFSGAATYDKDNSFQTTMSVVVLDVMPNGNLFIEGKRTLIVDGERKTIRLTGLVRRFDVASNNTISSRLVADAAIAYEGVGSLTRSTNRGWFSHLLDILWPF